MPEKHIGSGDTSSDYSSSELDVSSSLSDVAVDQIEADHPEYGMSPKAQLKGYTYSDTGLLRKGKAPEQSANFFSKFYFMWMNSTIYPDKYRGQLTQKDLPALTTRDDVQANKKLLFELMEEEKKRCTDENGNFKAEEFSMGRVTTKFLCPTILWSIPLKFIYDVFNYALPMIMSFMITWVEDYSRIDILTGERQADLVVGIYYVIAFCVISFTMSVILQQYFHLQNHLGVRLMGALSAAIYERAVMAPTTAIVNQVDPTGVKWNDEAESLGDGQVITLMSVDVNKLGLLMTYIHTLWSSPLQIIYALVLLYYQLGWAGLAGIPVVIIFMPISVFAARALGKLEKKLMGTKDGRMSKTAEFFNTQKILKMYGWEDKFHEGIEDLRDKELVALQSRTYARTWFGMVWTINPQLVMATVFGVLIALEGRLLPNQAFTAISLFNLLRFPLTMLPSVLSDFKTSQVALRRIKDFLLLPQLPRLKYNDINSAKNPITSKLESYDILHYDQKPALFDLKKKNMTFKKASHTGIVGKVGSGKTSFVSALLGSKRFIKSEDCETLDKNIDTRYPEEIIRKEQNLAKAIDFAGDFGYVPQEAWILNDTIRGNIVFDQPWDEAWYKTVVKACELTEDFKIMTDGDMTEIGEKGVNLSGGQKQRISIARAVYRKCDTYIVDDALSALDSHVAQRIVERVFSGLLSQRTVLLISHAVHIIETHCDRIIFIDDNRLVFDCPTDDGRLKENKKYLRYKKDAVEEAEAKEEELQRTERVARASILSVAESHEASVFELDDDGIATGNDNMVARGVSFLTHDASFLSKAVKVNETKVKQIAEDELKIAHVKLTDYNWYMKNYGIGIVLLVFIMYILYGTLTSMAGYFLTAWTELGSKWLDKQWEAYGIYLALSVLASMATVIGAIVSVTGQITAARTLHAASLKNVVKGTNTWYDSIPMGRLQNIFSKEMNNIDTLLPDYIRNTLYMGVSVISMLVMIAVGLPWFALALIPILAVYLYVMHVFTSPCRQIRRISSQAAGPQLGILTTTLRGVSSIRVMNEIDHFYNKNTSAVEAYMRSYYALNAGYRWLSARLEAVSALIVTLSAGLAVILAHYSDLDSSAVGLALSYALSSSQSLSWLVRTLVELENAAVSIERVKEFYEMNDVEGAAITGKCPKEFPATGQITFKDVTFKYKPELPVILNKMNLTIEPGTKVGICGRTGAGKSTIYVSLLRLVELIGGNILIDGVDISKIGKL